MIQVILRPGLSESPRRPRFQPKPCTFGACVGLSFIPSTCGNATPELVSMYFSPRPASLAWSPGEAEGREGATRGLSGSGDNTAEVGLLTTFFRGRLSYRHSYSYRLHDSHGWRPLHFRLRC